MKQILFSPTGGTKMVADAICTGIGGDYDVIDLCVPDNSFQETTISDAELVIIAMPVFGGRIPHLAVERLRNIKGNGAKCAVVVAYGNRHFDDALLELRDEATAAGFTVVAAVAAVAEHSIIREFGAGRPNAKDNVRLMILGNSILQKIEDEDADNLTNFDVPGNRPYKKTISLPHPKAGRSCHRCGLCASNCPVGAIPLDEPRSVDKKKCISCMRCVAVCPRSARGIGWLTNKFIALAIGKACSKKKENMLFL
ncbi:MAG: 4Fe-4S binding protein [Prevotella sp.]